MDDKKALLEEQKQLQGDLVITVGKLQQVSRKLGQLHKHKDGYLCDCQDSTLLCWKHGTILGSNVCKECGAYLGITEEY